MRESKANTLLNQYLRNKRMYCYYELKVCGGNLFPFSKIEQNQDEGLPALAVEGMVWKLSDEDMRKKPCDGFCTPPLPAYLVIHFAQKQLFVFVEYRFIQQMRAAGRKSISYDEAVALSTQVVSVH